MLHAAVHLRLADTPASPRRSAPAHSRWLAAAAVAQRAAAAALLDPEGGPRRAGRHLLDAWTALVLATWPNEPVPTDMELLARAEALLARVGAAPGEQARTWVELSTLLAGRQRGPSTAGSSPLGSAALAAHVARLDRLIAAAPLLVTTPRRTGRGLALALGLLGLGLGLLRFYPDTDPDIGACAAPIAARADLSRGTDASCP